MMGDLPADRLKTQRPFLISGLDLCVPFFTSYRKGRPHYKTYTVVFVCFATKRFMLKLFQIYQLTLLFYTLSDSLQDETFPSVSIVTLKQIVLALLTS